MINGISSLDRLYDIFLVQDRRSWDKRQGRGDKGNIINGIPECVFNTSLGSILERILTNDNKSVSPFPDLSDKICV